MKTRAGVFLDASVAERRANDDALATIGSARHTDDRVVFVPSMNNPHHSACS